MKVIWEKKKLHLNKRGETFLAKNLLRYIKKFNWIVSPNKSTLNGCISSDIDEHESSVKFNLSKLRKKQLKQNNFWTLSEISWTNQPIRLKEPLISKQYLIRS